MLFNSIEFAIFLPVVFLIYWCIGPSNRRYQNYFLLAASYFFYGWWDVRFLILILISTLTDYWIGLSLGNKKESRTRKVLLGISLIVNIGLLGYFKYSNFFIDNFVTAFTFLGYEIQADRLNIILPVGISFYTFQTLSYTIDVFKKKVTPIPYLPDFALYVSFFPQLVAGPIERATQLLPQIQNNRVFSYPKAVNGLRLILWGLFLKVVIADTSAIYADKIFAEYSSLNGSVLLLGIIYFSFQIYGDFAGYSSIAIGTAHLFGFQLMRNFAFPYFSRDIAEFWRRWHISLSTWFRDYLYIPLGGNRGTLYKSIRNIFIIFLVSGFWHGANWTFLAWGGIHASMYVVLFGFNINRKHINFSNRVLPSAPDMLKIVATFLLVGIAWVFFRAENIQHAFGYLQGIFSPSLFEMPNHLRYLPLVFILYIWEWGFRNREHGLDFKNFNIIGRYAIYFLMIIAILYYAGEEKQFIYFQF